MKKRDFIKIGGLATGVLLTGCTGSPADFSARRTRSASAGNNGLKLSFKPYELQLRHVFTVAANSRTTTH
jgi:hypothetical protein